MLQQNKDFPALSGLNGLNGKKCGWICKKLNKLISFVSKIPIVGRLASGVIEEVVKVLDYLGLAEDGELAFRTMIPYEPTVSEEVILDQIADKQIIPFVEASLYKISNAFNNPDFTKQLAEFNQVKMNVAIVENYVSQSDFQGLSAGAVGVLSQFVENAIQPIISLIDKSIAQHDQTIEKKLVRKIISNINLQEVQFANSIAGLAIDVEQLVATSKPNKDFTNTALLPNTPVYATPTKPMPTTTTTVPTKPVAIDPLKPTVLPVIPTAPKHNQETKFPNETFNPITDPAPVNTEDKASLKKKVGIAVIGMGILAVLFLRKKKTNN